MLHRLPGAQPGVEFDGLQVLERLANEAKAAAARRGLAVFLLIGRNFNNFRLVGDEKSFAVIIGNLLGNAVRHWDTELAKGSGGLVSVSTTTTAQNVEIEIRNAGHLTATQLQHCFEPYFRDEAQRFDSMHIGLSVSKEFSDEVGAELSLTNDGRRTVLARLVWPRAG